MKHTCCGFLMQRELDHLALDACERPLAAIVGGAKVSTKLPVIQSLMAKWCVLRCDLPVGGSSPAFLGFPPPQPLH